MSVRWPERGRKKTLKKKFSDFKRQMKSGLFKLNQRKKFDRLRLNTIAFYLKTFPRDSPKEQQMKIMKRIEG